MRISADEAREYFADITQQKASNVTPDELTDDPAFKYYAKGGVCLIFHRVPWPDVWMVHCGVKPDAWGKTISPTRDLLNQFWADEQPDLIIAWTSKNNRQLQSFTRRLGFRVSGEMKLPVPIVMQEWTP